MGPSGAVHSMRCVSGSVCAIAQSASCVAACRQWQDHAPLHHRPQSTVVSPPASVTSWPAGCPTHLSWPKCAVSLQESEAQRHSQLQWRSPDEGLQEDHWLRHAGLAHTFGRQCSAGHEHACITDFDLHSAPVSLEATVQQHVAPAQQLSDASGGLQDDILHEALTLEETLYYAAMLRLPRRLTAEQKKERVDVVIKALGLVSCKHTIIGACQRGGSAEAGAHPPSPAPACWLLVG